jgi:hypothetical protein
VHRWKLEEEDKILNFSNDIIEGEELFADIIKSIRVS